VFPITHQNPRRCPLNVPGPFYTLGTCCACEAPEYEAPDLLAPLTGDNFTTYFVKQPRTPEEIERACRAIDACCVYDLRYGGTDPAIIKRLGNNPLCSDYILRSANLVLTDHATASTEEYERLLSATRPKRRWWQFWK
jgi:hypothetical protein